MKKLLIILAAAIAMATSCNTTDPVLGTVVAMVSADKGVLYTDWGDKFIVTNSISGFDLSSGRFMIGAYVTKNLGGNTYEIQVSSIAKAVNNDILVDSEIQDQEAIGHDPMVAADYWAGAGWLNLRMQFIYLTGEGHVFNLSIDDKNSNTDTLYFDLRHNANKDTFGYEGVTTDNMLGGSIYGSFNFEKFIPKDKKAVILAIRSKWYKNNGITYIAETDTLTNFINYTME